MMAKPAIGKGDVMNGQFVVSTRTASWLRTCAGLPAMPINTPFPVILRRVHGLRFG
jgi:hypothetical protein